MSSKISTFIENVQRNISKYTQDNKASTKKNTEEIYSNNQLIKNRNSQNSKIASLSGKLAHLKQTIERIDKENTELVELLTAQQVLTEKLDKQIDELDDEHKISMKKYHEDRKKIEELHTLVECRVCIKKANAKEFRRLDELYADIQRTKNKEYLYLLRKVYSMPYTVLDSDRFWMGCELVLAAFFASVIGCLCYHQGYQY